MGLLGAAALATGGELLSKLAGAIESPAPLGRAGGPDNWGFGAGGATGAAGLAARGVTVPSAVFSARRGASPTGVGRTTGRLGLGDDVAACRCGGCAATGGWGISDGFA